MPLLVQITALVGVASVLGLVLLLHRCNKRLALLDLRLQAIRVDLSTMKTSLKNVTTEISPKAEKLIEQGQLAAASLRELLSETSRLERSVATLASGPLTQDLPGLRDSLSRLEDRLSQASSSLGQLLQAQTDAIRAYLSAWEEWRRHPFGTPTTAPMQPAAPHDAELEYQIQQLMKSRGVTREQALVELNPANSSSVWDAMADWR